MIIGYRKQGVFAEPHPMPPSVKFAIITIILAVICMWLMVGWKWTLLIFGVVSLLAGLECWIEVRRCGHTRRRLQSDKIINTGSYHTPPEN